MKVQIKKGSKHPKDKRIIVNGEQITFKDWAELGLFFYRNEDNIYDEPWHKGGEMVRGFINDVFDANSVTNEILTKYKLS